MDEKQNKLEEEIQAVIKRYTAESDLTYFDVIGVLEKIKLDKHYEFQKYWDKKEGR